MSYWMKMTSLVFCGLLILGSCQPPSKSPVEIRLFEIGAGWGYEILIRDTVFIHQPHIPVSGTVCPFANRQQAALAGKLVKQKIEQGLSPALSQHDLKALKISSVSC